MCNTHSSIDLTKINGNKKDLFVKKTRANNLVNIQISLIICNCKTIKSSNLQTLTCLQQARFFINHLRALNYISYFCLQYNQNMF